MIRRVAGVEKWRSRSVGTSLLGFFIFDDVDVVDDVVDDVDDVFL